MKESLFALCLALSALSFTGCANVNALGGRTVNVVNLYSHGSNPSASLQAPSNTTPSDMFQVPESVAGNALRAYMDGPGAGLIKKRVDETLTPTVEEILGAVTGPPAPEVNAPTPGGLFDPGYGETFPDADAEATPPTMQDINIEGAL